MNSKKLLFCIASILLMFTQCKKGSGSSDKLPDTTHNPIVLVVPDTPAWTCNSFFHYGDSSTYLLLPTMFTPDYDGLNDWYRVKKNFPVTDFYLSVAKKGGKIIFQTTDPTSKWDGRDSSGGISYNYSYEVILRFRDKNCNMIDTCSSIYIPIKVSGCWHAATTIAQWIFEDQIDPRNGSYNNPTNEHFCP